jgi:hypothetical protein
MNVLISPSSIFPAISGQANGAFPSGYVSVQQKQALLAEGSGLFTGNFADYEQERSINSTGVLPGLPLSADGFTGDGINKYYTSPTGYKAGNNSGVLYGTSGIFITYPPYSGGPEWESYNGSKGSGIFNFKNFISNFSNASDSREKASGIYDFTIFNDYIHYLPFAKLENEAVEDTNIVGGEGLKSLEVRVPFVSDLIPTSQVWDRYGTKEEEQEEDGTDPDYGTDNGNTETTGDQG